MAGGYNGEQYAVEQMVALLKAHLSTEMIRVGLDATSVPDPTHGYTDDSTLPPRDGAFYIAVWVDSVETAKLTVHADRGASGRGRIYDRIILGIQYNFTFRRETLGRLKRLSGEAIRNIIHAKIYQYIKTASNVTTTTDYRFGGKRTAGGSKRDLAGKPLLTGTLTDSLVVGTHFEIRRDISIRPGLIP